MCNWLCQCGEWVDIPFCWRSKGGMAHRKTVRHFHGRHRFLNGGRRPKRRVRSILTSEFSPAATCWPVQPYCERTANGARLAIRQVRDVLASSTDIVVADRTSKIAFSTTSHPSPISPIFPHGIMINRGSWTIPLMKSISSRLCAFV